SSAVCTWAASFRPVAVVGLLIIGIPVAEFSCEENNFNSSLDACTLQYRGLLGGHRAMYVRHRRYLPEE
ncbi:MAG: hypothetical protein ACE5KS_03830, partial [Woeseiaceae bacterium]